MLDQSHPIPASQVATVPQTRFTRVPVRAAQRGLLADTFAARRVWTVREGQLASDWLGIRRHLRPPGPVSAAKQQISYALANAPAHPPRARRAELTCLR